MFMKGYFSLLISFLLAILFASPVEAQLTTNLLISPKAMALGNAVTADPPGIMAIQYNPAGLSNLDGRQFEVDLLNAYIAIDANFIAPPGYNVFGISGLSTDPVTGKQADPVANTHSHTHTLAIYVPGFGIRKLPLPVALVPTGGFSIKPPGSKITFGNAFYIPMAAGFARKQTDPGRYQPLDMAMERVTYLSPTISYQINDHWSVGAGVHLSYQAVGTDMDLRAPNMLLGVAQVLQNAFNCKSGNEPLAPWLELCGGNVGPWDNIGVMRLNMQDTLSPTYSFGVLWKPNPWFRWGAAYLSGDNMNMRGTYELDYTKDWSGFWQSVNSSLLGAIGAAILSLPSGVPREAGNVSMHLTYPQHFQTGISVDITPKITVNADVNWSDWKAWDAFHLKFDRKLEFLSAARILAPNKATPNSLDFPLGFEDTWNVGVGVTLHASSRLDLRAGVERRSSVIPANQRSVMAPFGGANLWGVGMGYQWSKNTHIDMSLAYLHSQEYIPANTSCNVNCTDLTNLIYNPYAGLDIKTSLTAVLAGLSFRTKF